MEKNYFHTKSIIKSTSSRSYVGKGTRVEHSQYWRKKLQKRGTEIEEVETMFDNCADTSHGTIATTGGNGICTNSVLHPKM